MNGVFITGTDTGVGKTRVAARLLRSLREGGLDAVPVKPVQTGCVRRRGRLVAPDLEFTLRTAGMKATCRERELMCPYRFRSACSPHLAAERERRAMSVSHILSCCRTLATRHEYLVVEGAGGVRVPLTRRTTMLDLMKRLGLPVVIVARPGLGTINHTLLSIEAVREAGLVVLGVIFNETAPVRHGYIEQDNLRTIQELGETQVLGWVRYGRLGSQAVRL